MRVDQDDEIDMGQIGGREGDGLATKGVANEDERGAWVFRSGALEVGTKAVPATGFDNVDIRTHGGDGFAEVAELGEAGSADEENAGGFGLAAAAENQRDEEQERQDAAKDRGMMPTVYQQNMRRVASGGQGESWTRGGLAAEVDT